MKYYLHYTGRLFMLCSLFLSINFYCDAQSKNQTNVFLDALNKTEALTSTGKPFSLNEAHPFLHDTEFFKQNEQKLVLPFQGAIWKTIPEFVETGGKSFDQLIDSTIDGKPLFNFLISKASELFDVEEEQIELHFLYYLKSSDELIGGKNMILVSMDNGHTQVSLQSITEAEIDINPHPITNSLEKFYQNSEWKSRVAALSGK